MVTFDNEVTYKCGCQVTLNGDGTQKAELNCPNHHQPVIEVTRRFRRTDPVIAKQELEEAIGVDVI